jgi:PAS domain S-box-containing protein
MPSEQSNNPQTELALLRQRVATLENELAQAYANSDALLALFDSLGDGLVLLDGTGKVLAVNQAMAAMLDESVTMIHGHAWGDVCKAHGGEGLEKLVQQTRQDGKPYQSREQFINVQGHSYILDMQTFTLLHNEQQRNRIILHVVDITERLQLEAMLIQSERRAATGKLSATIAHEVNTPLQAIKSMLYMAARTSEQQRIRHLSQSSEQIDRISSILERLLDLHHVRDNPPTLVNLNMLLERLLESLQATLEEQRIEVHARLQEHVPPVWGKFDDLSQAMLNLVLNAIESMPDGGTLEVRTRTRPDRQYYLLVVEIADTGYGIETEVLPRIFDPFFTTRQGNSGIGLSVSKKIVIEHGGQITVRSAPRMGSTFVLTFPISANHKGTDSTGAA